MKFASMEEVTVSPKYQIVIPKKIRESLKIRPGQKLIMMTEDGTIELRPFSWRTVNSTDDGCQLLRVDRIPFPGTE